MAVKISALEIEAFINLCLEAKTIDDLVENTSIAFQGMGFSSNFYHYIPHLGSYDYNVKKIAHIPEEHRNWVMETFPKNIYVSPRDPFESYVLKTGRIEWIHDLKNRNDFQSRSSQDFLKVTLDRFGHCFIVPAFGPRRSRGYFLLPIDKAQHKPGIRDMAYVEYICSFYHRCYNAIRTFKGERVALTPREHEVLQLIPIGLSNPDIGKILKISTNTVNGHVKNIFLKMDVTDRLTASLRAFALDLVD